MLAAVSFVFVSVEFRPYFQSQSQTEETSPVSCQESGKKLLKSISLSYGISKLTLIFGCPLLKTRLNADGCSLFSFYSNGEFLLNLRKNCYILNKNQGNCNLRHLLVSPRVFPLFGRDRQRSWERR